MWERRHSSGVSSVASSARITVLLLVSLNIQWMHLVFIKKKKSSPALNRFICVYMALCVQVLTPVFRT